MKNIPQKTTYIREYYLKNRERILEKSRAFNRTVSKLPLNEDGRKSVWQKKWTEYQEKIRDGLGLHREVFLDTESRGDDWWL